MALSYKKLKDISSKPWYHSEMTMTYSDGSKLTGGAQYFVTRKETNFNGWECDIGKDLLVIDVDNVYRSVCLEGGVLSKVQNNFTWQDDSIICQKNDCNCGIDLQEPKRSIM
jgi:hypothetical protein